MTVRSGSGNITALAVWLVASLAVQVSLADSGYRTDFDYPGRGDDWYGRFLPDPGRDFPANPVDQASDGDDFGRGYEILVASPGYGPPLASTENPEHEYRFRFGDRYTDWQECYVDSNCQDSYFCNGTEACTIDGTCRSGSPPSCDDADPCTDDSCSDELSQCLHDPLPDPGEVPALFLSRAPSSTIATLNWSDQPAAESFNVYRAESHDMSDMTCYEPDVVGTSLEDDGTIGEKGLYEYLVNSNGCGGTSTLGKDWEGVDRTPLSWCP